MVAAGLLIAAGGYAFASQGCDAVNAGVFNLSYNSFSYSSAIGTFATGDELSFSITSTGNFDWAFSGSLSPGGEGRTTTSITFTVSNAGGGDLIVSYTGNPGAISVMGSSTPGAAPTNIIPFPMVGIGFGQTLQLNVVSFNPCQMQLAIFDSNGTAVASGSGSPPETIGFTYGTLKIDYRNQVPRFPHRAELRAEVTLQPTTTSPCQAQASVEVYDDVAKSTWVLTPGLHPPSPCIQSCSATTIGPVGVGFLQAVRMNVVAHPPQPCVGTLSFVDVRGERIGLQSPVSLGPGQATFLDLSGHMVVQTFDGHGEVIGIFTPSPTTAPVACIASVQVVDQTTGYTRALILPGVGHE
jgi:hypothetical protein